MGEGEWNASQEHGDKKMGMPVRFRVSKDEDEDEDEDDLDPAAPAWEMYGLAACVCGGGLAMV
jgi:hypothetical protein